jgi:carboxypeptidase D
VTATSEEDIAQDFIKFFQNFQDIFGIKNFKIYVTGESYAGRYVPYISAAMLDENNKKYFDLNGENRHPRYSSKSTKTDDIPHFRSSHL